MSSEYVENKIREALKLANGNTTRARQQLIAWCYEDAQLLQLLVKPHLTGIVAYNIERVTSGRAQKAKANTPINRAPEPKAPQNDGHFGMEILKAVAGNSGAVFGLEGPSAPGGRRTGVSEQHLDAIRALTGGNSEKK